MAIEDILKRIDEDSTAAAEKVLDAARRDAAAVASEFDEKAERLRTKLRERAEKRASEEERRFIVNEQLEIRKIRLAKKREILNRLYDTARRRLDGLPTDRYRDILKSLILDGAVSGTEEIVVPPARKELFNEAFLAELNGAYPGGGGFTLSPDAGDFGWGVVLRQGKRVVNLSLEVLFEQLCERIEPELSAVLFPAGGEQEKG